MQWAGDGAALYYAFGERSRAMRAAIDQRKNFVGRSAEYCDDDRGGGTSHLPGTATRNVVETADLDPAISHHFSSSH